MRIRLGIALCLALLSTACGGGGFYVGDDGGGTSYVPAHFVHVVDPGNVLGHSTRLSHPSLDGNPNAVVVVTPVWNPGGGTGEYVDEALGVEYGDGTGRWLISVEDGSPMPEGAAFAVSVYAPAGNAFLHTTTAGTIDDHSTFLDHPAANGNPDALVIATHVWNPGGGAAGSADPHHLGVWYSGIRGRWAIFHQDLAPMPEGVHYGVLVLPPGPGAFAHTASAANSSGNSTFLAHPALDGQPGALFHLMSNFNPGGGLGVYNDRAIGAWYSGARFAWAVFEQDVSPMPEGAAFNVWIP